MDQSPSNDHGASPMPKGKSKPGAPLFKKPKSKPEKKQERDMTGQTDTSLKHMKQRLAEIPKKSSGSKHDKTAYEDGE
ncbi:hypothetical protein BH10BAC4_BH10BAC4_19820 [soil metagenome]